MTASNIRKNYDMTEMTKALKATKALTKQALTPVVNRKPKKRPHSRSIAAKIRKLTRLGTLDYKEIALQLNTNTTYVRFVQKSMTMGLASLAVPVRATLWSHPPLRVEVAPTPLTLVQKVKATLRGWLA